MAKKIIKKKVEINNELQDYEEEIKETEAPVQAQEEINTTKEERRKFLLDLQATLARERITRLSDIERRLEELDR